MDGLHEIILRITKDEEVRVKRALAGATPRIAEGLRPLVEAAFRQTAEYGELAGGGLNAVFGLRDGKLAAEGVAVAVGAAVRGEVRADGSVLFSAFRKDFSDALGAETAVYASQSRRRPGPFPVPWLEWYLFRGGEATTPGYGLAWKKGGRGKASKTPTGLAFRGSRVAPLMLPLRGRIQEAFTVPAGGGGWLDRVAAIARPRLIALVEAEAGKIARV